MKPRFSAIFCNFLQFSAIFCNSIDSFQFFLYGQQWTCPEEQKTKSRANFFPSIVGDRYKFDDSTHLNSFYAQFESMSDEDFASLFAGKTVNSVSKRLKNDVFTDQNNMYTPFLSDPFFREVCNENFEFQVGDALITYINNEQILLSDPNNINVKNAIRSMTKGRTVGKNAVPVGAFWNDDTSVKSLLSAPCSCDIKIEQLGCNKVRVFGSCRDVLWGSGQATVQITLNFNSNSTTPQTPSINSRIEGNFEFILTPTNPMTIQALVSPDCVFGNTKFVFFNFNPSSAKCDSRDRSTGLQLFTNGNEAIRAEVKTFQNFWSQYEESQVFSSTRGSDGQLRKSDAKLSARIDASRRGPFDCNVFATENETKTCTSCKERKARVNTGVGGVATRGNHCTGDVFGTFNKVKDGVTINQVVTLPFECCL